MNILKYKPISVGDIVKSNNFGVATVIAVDNKGTARDYVSVQFQSTGTITKVRVAELRQGQFKDVFYPSVCGIGYLGQGPYKCNKSDKTYNTWSAMLHRCYGIKQSGNYVNCTVCSEWLNYQTFASWYNKHYVEGYELDKDILIPNSNIYSPQTCLLLPKSVNGAEAYLRKAVIEDSTLQPLYEIFRNQVIQMYS